VDQLNRPKGVALNFVTAADTGAMREFESFYGTQIEELPMNLAEIIEQR
jgi:hypothetical protein